MADRHNVLRCVSSFDLLGAALEGATSASRELYTRYKLIIRQKWMLMQGGKGLKTRCISIKSKYWTGALPCPFDEKLLRLGI